MLPCPRRNELGSARITEPETDHWREEQTCSYCGSLSPERFFALALSTGTKLSPTDKDYKVYVEHHDPDEGKPWIYMSQSGRDTPDGDGWEIATEALLDTMPMRNIDKEYLVGRWVKVGTKSGIQHDKFYFQHLDVAGRKRFVELMNQKKFTIGEPGYFYVPPFFVRAAYAPEVPLGDPQRK